MSLYTSISRFTGYYQRNGIGSTAKRLGLAIKRVLFANRMVVFYRDIPSKPSPTAELPSSVVVERKRKQSEISAEDLHQITSFWNPTLARRTMNERFALGASLWFIKSDGNLAGYGWTLQGRTVEPHYFPLGQNDVQFLDFHVFPKYRGRAMDWVLIDQIVSELAAEGCKRAYGESAEWNKASLSSFAMTSFCRLGLAKKVTILGRTIVWWTGNQAVEQKRESERASLATGGKRPTVPDLR